MSTETSTGTSIDASIGTTTGPDTGTSAGAEAAARQDGDQGREAEQPLGVVGAEGAGHRAGALGRLRAGASHRPVLTGALVALLAAGAAFGGGFAVGRVTAPAAATLVPGDGLERVAPGDGMMPPDGLGRDGFGPGGQDDGTGEGTEGGTGDGTGGVQDGSST